MPLHPQVQAALAQMIAAGPPLHHLSPTEARQAILAMRATKGAPEQCLSEFPVVSSQTEEFRPSILTTGS